MLKPLWALKLDAGLTATLAEMVNRELCRVNGENIYTTEYINDIMLLARQIDLQMEEQNVKLDSDTPRLLVRVVIPEAERVPYIPVRTSFLFEGNPVGEIQTYNPETGIIIVHIQDPAIISQIHEGNLPQLEVYEEAI